MRGFLLEAKSLDEKGADYMLPESVVAQYFNGLAKALQDDDDYAWSWHANLATAFMDAGVPHNVANEGAANFMARCFDVDTSGWPQRFEAEDNWKHRASNMKCKTCMWFVVKSNTAEHPDGMGRAATGELGRCRRHAPTMSGFPGVFESDWCGDHKLDENKI